MKSMLMDEIQIETRRRKSKILFVSIYVILPAESIVAILEL